MIEKIQSNFDLWLAQHSEFKDGLDSSVLVIAVIGKEVAGNTKADLLNNFVGKVAFCNDRKNSLFEYLNCDMAIDVQTESSSPLIDIYFDSEESIIWLLINGFNDVEIQNLLFNNTTDNFKNKSFFEKLAFIEREQMFALAQIFPLCNALLFIEQGCRFDLEWICLLKRLNNMRPSISRRIRSTFSSLSLSETELSTIYPSSFVNNCRIGVSTRLLFCFYRNPLRSDLGISKKKELLEKMEKCLETQIAHLFKQNGLVDIKHPTNAFAQITISSGTPFVYCFNQSEMPIDKNHELAEALFGSLGEGCDDDVNSVKSGGGVLSPVEIQNIITSITKPSKLDKEELENSSDYNFPFFLHKAISKLRKDLTFSKGQKLSFFELPTLGQFIETAKILRKCVFEEKMGGESSELKIITPEIDSFDSLVEFSIKSALAIYKRQLARQPKMTGGDAVFSKIEHEYSLKMAVEHLRLSYPRSASLNKLDNIISQLTIDCENIWKDGHQRCETRSLTGQLCAYSLNHELTGNIENIKAKSRKNNYLKNQHCSGVKTFSLCNCGMSRRIRNDPFTLKEANFTFYNETGDDNFNFGSCCANLDKYQFKLFEPSTASSERQFNKGEEIDDVNIPKADLLPLQGTEKKVKHPPQPELHSNLPNEIEDSLAIDPNDFNVRFFDEGDKESGDEINEKIDKIKLSTQEEDEKGVNNQILLLGEDECEDEEDEQIRKRNVNLSDEEFSEGEYDDDDEEEDDEEEEEEEENAVDDQNEKQNYSSPKQIIPSSSAVNEDIDNSSPEPPEMHYLDEYDSHLTRKDEQNIENKITKKIKNKLKYEWDDLCLEENFKGQYIDYVPHSLSSPSLLPLFPSFSVVCIGHSSLYNHSTGIRGHDRNARFRNGSEFLLSWGVRLLVNTERWIRELQYIGVNPTEQTLRNLQNGIAHGRIESKEKVKLFVGFDYECPRGHRFTCCEPSKILKHRKASGPLNQDAGPLLDSDLPLWMPCPCRKEPRTTAQLMRVHVVTPKAPVAVTLQPRIQISDDSSDGFFFPGAMERIELGWAKYYVCRLPYIYLGPNKEHQPRPNSPEFKGKFLRHSISVSYLPISTT